MGVPLPSVSTWGTWLHPQQMEWFEPTPERASMSDLVCRLGASEQPPGQSARRIGWGWRRLRAGRQFSGMVEYSAAMGRPKVGPFTSFSDLMQHNCC